MGPGEAGGAEKEGGEKAVRLADLLRPRRMRQAVTSLVRRHV